MKLSKFDIGADVISILTRGMYPDPKDAVREYIQNAVDAKAENIAVKIRQNSLVVEDKGVGMNHEVLRKAVRLGISDKNPKKDVGFMGIGIYSAFHLCNKLTILSRGSDNMPNRLIMDFGSMRQVLQEQRDQRLAGNLTADELIDLQTLLSKYVSVTENNDIDSATFPNIGTRVELSGLIPEFYEEIANYEHMANYLREVIPLGFSPDFRWGQQIENDITEQCQRHGARFELVRNLSLQVNAVTNQLYRPYKDSDFLKGSPQAPDYQDIISNGQFFGVAWGCLNSARNKVVKDLRGFLLRKQGFAIGKRENLVQRFPRGNTFFDRYIGEIILVHPDILPNASRNDLEYSDLRTVFFSALTQVASHYDAVAGEYQEFEKTDEELAKATQQLRAENNKFDQYRENASHLLEQVKVVGNLIDKIKARDKIRPNMKPVLEKILTEALGLQQDIQRQVLSISQANSQTKSPGSDRKKPAQTAKVLAEQAKQLPKPIRTNYESLVEMLEDSDVSLTDFLKQVLDIIDERFIELPAENREHYYQLLNELKAEINSLYA